MFEKGLLQSKTHITRNSLGSSSCWSQMQEKIPGLARLATLINHELTSQNADSAARVLYDKLGLWNESESKTLEAIDQKIVKDPG